MASATTLGLVSGGTVPGKVDGASVAAGYLGEVLTASVTTTTVTTTESDVTGATFALSAGVWLVQFSATIRIATGSTVGNEHAIGVYLTNAANTRQGLDKTLALKTPASGQLDVTTALSGIILLNIASATTYKLRAKLTNFTGTAAAAQIVSAAENYTNFQATRIA